MRYEEIRGPFGEGWTYGEDGTIHTPSGYRCTPQQIEGMLWMFGCLPFKPDKYLIHSDEAAGAMRPLLEHSDIDGTIEPHRYTLHQSGFGREASSIEDQPSRSSPKTACCDRTSEVARWTRVPRARRCAAYKPRGRPMSSSGAR